MPGISNELKEKFADVIEKAQKKLPDAEIVFLKSSAYPLHRQRVRFSVTSMRKADLLEEYVMKAASLGISGGMDTDMLSKMLGMDEVFLLGCINDLAGKSILEKDALPALVLTEAGAIHASAGTVPADEEIEEVEYFIDKKSGIFYTAPVSDPSCEIWEHYSLIDKYVENIKKYISRKFICDVGKALGKIIETPDGTRRITSMISAKITGEAHTLITELKLKTADGKTAYMIWDHAKGIFRNDLAGIVQKYYSILTDE